jgi:hypothetical protein
VHYQFFFFSVFASRPCSLPASSRASVFSFMTCMFSPNKSTSSTLISCCWQWRTRWQQAYRLPRLMKGVWGGKRSTADDPQANYKFVRCLLRSLVSRRLVTSRLAESRVRRLCNVLGIAATYVARDTEHWNGASDHCRRFTFNIATEHMYEMPVGLVFNITK